MNFSDMHTHTTFSFDGHFSPEDMILSAISKKLFAIAFTEHYDIGGDGTNKYYDSRRLQRRTIMEELREKYAGKIKVLYGIEIGQPYAAPEQAIALSKSEPFDVVIGGVHEAPLGQDIYERGYTCRQDCDQLLDSYFVEMERIFSCDCFDILAHIDFPLRVMGQYFTAADLTPYRDRVEPIVKKAAQKGLAFEVNTQGVRNWQGAPCPQKWVLEYFRACGGEMVTIGSDAHHIDHVGCGAAEACRLISSAGFKYVTSFEKRKPVFTEIEV